MCQIIRDLFLEKKKVPTLDNILTKLKSINVSDVVQNNLFEINLFQQKKRKSGLGVALLSTDTCNQLVSFTTTESVIKNTQSSVPI